MAKRERLLCLLGNPRRRKKALDSLNHFADWDNRYARQIDSSVPLETIADQLKAAGAPGSCHLISDNRMLDGHDMPLEEALAAADAASFASLLCCKPGVVAFYFGEASTPRDRTLLWRPFDCRNRTGLV